MRLAWQIVTVAVLGIAGAGAWYAFGGGGPAGPAPGGGPGGPGGGRAVSVVAEPATVGDIQVTFDAVGTLRANEAVTVTSKQTGIVRAIQFTEGQRVEAGAVLVELDDTEVRAELAVAEARRRNAEQQLERARRLLPQQAVAEARVDELRIDLQGAEAQMRAAQARLQDLTIRAPFAGVTGLRHVSPGALVRPGEVVTTVDDVQVVKLEFGVPETALRSLAQGMPVRATSTVYPDRGFDGSVAAIDTRVDPVTRTLAVVAELPNPDGLLKPGMFMTVRLMLENRQNVVLAPEEALVPSGDRQFVYVVVDGRVERRPIRIAARQSGRVEVTEGLRPGEMIVTRGVQKIREGAPVQVQGAAGGGGGGVAAAPTTRQS